MKKLLLGLLTAVLGLNAAAEIKPDDWRSESSESMVGIHLISDYGNGQQVLSKEIAEDIISKELNKLDWENNFYQFVVVIEPGVSMEVGGSLNGVDGLSAMYRNRHKRIDAVIKQPPETVKQMEEILFEFVAGNDAWKKKYDFDFMYY